MAIEFLDEEGGFNDPVWMAKAALYHAMQTSARHVYEGICAVIDILTSEDTEDITSSEVLDVLMTVSLAGGTDHRGYSFEPADPEEEIEAFRDWLNGLRSAEDPHDKKGHDES